MHDFMESVEAKKVLEIAAMLGIRDYDDLYQKIYLKKDQVGLPENLSCSFIEWVIANNQMAYTDCEGCAFVTDMVFGRFKASNYCRDCEKNPKPVLWNKYKDASKWLEKYEE